MGDFDNNQSITTDPYQSSWRKTLPGASKFGTRAQHHSAQVTADSIAKRHAQFQVMALGLGYITVDIC